MPEHIIVNYHYVRDPSPEWRGIWPCPVAEFERQINYLSENYKVVSVSEAYTAAKEERKGKYAAITFDDGLKDQYENAVPILEKYNTAATFFPITSTFEGGVPGTHKLHVLLSKVSAEKIVDMFNKKFGQEFQAISKEKRVNNQRRLFEDVLTANLKEKLLALTPQAKDSFLNKAFQHLDLDEGEFARELFMSESNVKELKKKGFEVGSHTHGHYSLESQGKAEAERDILVSREKLRELLAEAPTLISYPHGRVSDEIEIVLKNKGFRYGVTINPGPLSGNEAPFRIPRLDTNDLKRMMRSV